MGIGASELFAALKLIQMLGVDGEKDAAAIKEVEHVLDRQAVDPGVEDSDATPPAPLLLPNLHVVSHASRSPRPPKSIS